MLDLHIPAPLEYARFRKPERIIIKAHFFVKGSSLKNKCNDEYVLLRFPPKGWFINALCCVIDFDNRITIIFNQCLA
jgi:hypothetical protein